MNAVGIIAEYNPFHNGHAYQIREAKKRTGADCAVIAMSGDFVQRGAPAILDKVTRTRMALLGGADIVFEMPAVSSCAASRDFARCGCAMLSAAGCRYLSFGTDGGSLSALQKTADVLAAEPEPFRSVLRDAQKEGETYAAAEAKALGACGASFPPGGANSRLAVEYLRALRESGASLQPVPILRSGMEYTAGSASAAASGGTRKAGMPGSDMPGAGMPAFPEETRPSALFLRQALAEGVPDKAFRRWIPESALPVLLEARHLHRMVFPEDCAALLNYAILTCPDPAEIAGFSADLAARLKKAGSGFRSVEEWTDYLKTRNLTRTRVSRALMHLLLQLRKDSAAESALQHTGPAPYLRLLGFRKSAAGFLSELKDCCPVSVIQRPAIAERLLSPDAFRVFSADLQAAAIYRQILADRHGVRLPDEYRAGIVILDS